jgi:predicted phage-related endonuclease
MRSSVWTKRHENRRAFIGGSDARIIMGGDETALVRLSLPKILSAAFAR